MQVDVEDRLTRVGIAVEHGPVASLVVACSRAIDAARLTISPTIASSASDRSLSVATWRRGTISTCIGACGLMSWKATRCSSLKTILAGMSPATSLQNRQSLTSSLQHRGSCDSCRSCRTAPPASLHVRRRRAPDFLTVAEFNNEDGMRGKQRREGGEQPFDDGHTVGSAKQRRRRFVVSDVDREDARIPVGHVRRIGDDEVCRPPQAAAEIRLDEMNPVANLMALRIARATSSASREMSVATTTARGRSAASVTARQPLPVPTSMTVDARSGRIRRASSTISSVSGRGTRVSGVTRSPGPELAVAGDHRDGLAPRPSIDEG